MTPVTESGNANIYDTGVNRRLAVHRSFLQMTARARAVRRSDCCWITTR